jgi:hypothetical protein
MNSLERRLIELNEALLNLTTGRGATSPEMLDRARQVLAGGASIDTGPGNDTVIVNHQVSNGECHEGKTGYTGSQGEQGPIGYTGSAGESGEQGPPGEPGPIGYTGSAGECNCECQAILVSQDYTATLDDYYIGVNSTGPVTITLPTSNGDCGEIIIKAEMGPPLGNRKITIITSDGSFIDGEDDYVIEVPYQSVNLLQRGGDWWII